MKAKEFIQKFGWNDARVCILNCACPEDRWFMRRGDLVSDQDFDDLKRLVESYELVAIHGFEESKEIVANAPSDDHFYSWTLGGSGVRDKTVNIGELRKAIADVESCMEVSSESN